jgi:hypothetical protein
MSMITDITHPDYELMLQQWIKWRYTYESGHIFILKYLKQFSNREDDNDFLTRRDMTYCPAFAKAALDEVKNSIYQRMADVTRQGGSNSYQDSCLGLQQGVDLCGSSMNYYIGCNVLEEMLKMKKVGVYVDMPNNIGASLADARGKHPYLYTYVTENIRAWALDDSEDPSQFKAVLLRDYIYEYDPDFGFPISYTERFRRIWRQDGAILVSFYNEKSEPVDKLGNKIDQPIVLELPVVPFVLFEISDSLMRNIADYQIALLNLASADMSYALKANFPFYTEQYEPRADSTHMRAQGDGTQGQLDGAGVARNEEVKVGVSKGRRYPRGLNAPAFIHPSPEPLMASMTKQDQLKAEIRELMSLTLKNLKGPKMASAESKSKDEASLEAGLSYIGLTLENGERKIANIWSMYETKNMRKPVNVATVNYPDNYTLRTESDRRNEAQQLGGMLTLVPSKTYQRNVGKKLATVLLGSSVSRETMVAIGDEIDKAPGLSSDPDVITTDVQNGLVSVETASQLRGYPKGESEKAKSDHAERLARIQAYQSPAGGDSADPSSAGARGVLDKSGDAQAGKKEKQGQRDPTGNDTGKVPVRGKAAGANVTTGKTNNQPPIADQA